MLSRLSLIVCTILDVCKSQQCFPYISVLVNDALVHNSEQNDCVLHVTLTVSEFSVELCNWILKKSLISEVTDY